MRSITGYPRNGPYIGEGTFALPGLSVRGGGGGADPLEPVSDDWWHPNAVLDLDFENGRYYFNGAEYASKAAMVTAGFYTIDATNGDSLNVTGLIPSTYTAFFKGVTSSSGSPANPEYGFELKGAGAAGNNIVRLYRANTTPAINTQGADNAGSTQWAVATVQVAASSAIAGAVRVKANSIGISINGNSTQTDTSATVPTVTSMKIGNRAANDRPWNGTIHRITIINEDSTNTELERMRRLFQGLDSNVIYDAIIEPFQMEPTIAQYYNGYVVIGAVTGSGDGVRALALEIDVSRKRMTRIGNLHSWSAEDEHLAPTALFLSDGSLFCAGTGHENGDLIYWRKSATGRVGAIGSETQYASALTAPNYMSTLQRTSTELFMLTHEDDAGGVSGVPNQVYLKSTDTGATFAECRAFTGRPTATPPGGGQNQLYSHVARPDADTVWVFTVAHDSNDDAQFKLVEIDLSTGDVITRDNAGAATVEGNMFTDTANTTPITDHDDMPAPWAKTASKKQIELMLRDDGSMAMMQEVNNSDDGDSVLWLCRLTGSNPFNQSHWTLTELPFGSYYTDACFARESHSGIRVYFTWNDSGTYRLTRADSSDNGASWTYTNLLASALELRRPVSPVNATAALPVFCVEFVSRVGPTNFDARLVWP